MASHLALCLQYWRSNYYSQKCLLKNTTLQMLLFKCYFSNATLQNTVFESAVAQNLISIGTRYHEQLRSRHFISECIQAADDFTLSMFSRCKNFPFAGATCKKPHILVHLSLYLLLGWEKSEWSTIAHLSFIK